MDFKKVVLLAILLFVSKRSIAQNIKAVELYKIKNIGFGVAASEVKTLSWDPSCSPSS